MGNYFLNKISILLLISLAMVITLALGQGALPGPLGPGALGQGTRIGFYAQSCPRVETIVETTIKKHVDKDKSVAPALLRLVFHDCFVHGCDASILIEGPDTEKAAGINRLLRGYEVIDDVKKEVEKACPGVVSCADILALAARDSTVLAGALTYAVPTGRRDGRISSAADTTNLPSYTDSVAVLKKKFADKGLTAQDLVTLSGGHTVGTVTCQVIIYRLYNYTSSGGADPSIDTAFLPKLRELCPFNGDGWKHIPLDYGSGDTFDHHFFANLQSSRAILESDQRLWADASTKYVVEEYIGIRGMAGLTLNFQFGRAMLKMTNIGVKTGKDGEIRKNCSRIN